MPLSKFARLIGSAASRGTASAAPKPSTDKTASSFAHLRQGALSPTTAHRPDASATEGLDAASTSAEFIIRADRMRRGEIPVGAAAAAGSQAAFIIAADRARRGEK